MVGTQCSEPLGSEEIPDRLGGTNRFGGQRDVVSFALPQKDELGVVIGPALQLRERRRR